MKIIVPMKLNIAYTVLILMTLACSSVAPQTKPTSTSTLEPATSTATLKPTSTPRPTATPNVAATQQYDDMFGLIKTVQANGQIATLDGTFFPLDDFTYEWAQIHSYNFFDAGQTVDNFVVKAHFKWSSAIANPESSGCGFVFRIGDNGSHYLAFLSADAVIVDVYIPNLDRRGSYRIGVAKGSGRVHLGNPAEADFAIVANEGHAYAYVNGNFAAEYALYSTWYKYDQGALAYTIVSGTNKDYGTRCEITNAGLWKISQ